MGSELDLVIQPACKTDADDGSEDTFVDVMGHVHGKEGAESEGLTFTDALMHANLMSETPLEDLVNTSEKPLC